MYSEKEKDLALKSLKQEVIDGLKDIGHSKEEIEEIQKSINKNAELLGVLTSPIILLLKDMIQKGMSPEFVRNEAAKIFCATALNTFDGDVDSVLDVIKKMKEYTIKTEEYLNKTEE